MDVTGAIQLAVARADLLLCRLAALPWKRVAASVALAAAVIYAVKAVREDG